MLILEIITVSREVEKADWDRYTYTCLPHTGHAGGD